MPRVTYEIYRQRHLQLSRLWREHEGLFVLVDPQGQWALHEYFLCVDQPTESGLRTHYEALKLEGSSLPHRAGKAYAELMRRLAQGVPVGQRDQIGVVASPRRKDKAVAVRSLVHPHLDVDEFVRIGLGIVERLAREERSQS